MVGDLKDAKYQRLFEQRNLSADDPGAAHIGELITAFFASISAEEAHHGGQERGLAIGVIRSPEEQLNDPHFREDRGFFSELDHEEIGRKVTYPGRPYVFQKTPWQLRRRAPRLGEHNEEVYRGELGLSRERLITLGEAGVV